MDRPHPRLVTVAELRDRTGVFRDREHAGEVLAGMLKTGLPRRSVILAIPAGGVPVAAEISRRLGLPLDLAVVSKVLLPWDTEAGYGAVAWDGTVRLNDPLIAALGLSPQAVQAGIAATRERVARRVRTLRGDRPLPDLAAVPAVLVDDGLASGYTMKVAVEALRKGGASAVHVAVPTGHLDAVERVALAVDSVFCPNVRGGRSFAVAAAYRSWADVSEDEVRAILGRPEPGPS